MAAYLIGNWSKLNTLDLSFNNLTGQIPDALFNLSSLSYLFLGSNKLAGTLPAQISTSLLNVNLVANNFTVESSNNSVLPSGLRCLQRNFPCNRNSPVYYNFSIKCSGPQITSDNQIT